MKQCQHPYCTNLTNTSFCNEHKPKRNTMSRYINKYSYLYNSMKWRRASKRYLLDHIVCVKCKVNQSEIVDHKRPHKGNEIIFWNKKNWVALCRKCHGRKTAIEDVSLNGSSKRMGV